MNYKIKPGYVLLKVCDTHLLVANRQLWDNSSRVRVIPKKYAVCWALMEQGKTSDDVIRSLAELLHKPIGEVEKRLTKTFQNLAEDGYLIEVKEDGI